MTEGESVTLECQITGHPAPTLQWFREDFRIESSIDFQISYQNGVAQMVIREAFAEDSGRFTCTATNEAGTISTSCYLLVKGSVQQPKKWPLSFVSYLWPTYIIIKKNNTSFTIIVSVSEEIESRDETIVTEFGMAQDKMWVNS